MPIVHINPAEGDSDDLPDGLLERGVLATLEAGGVREGEVSITFLDDDGIRELNRRYLGRDRVTDVIAFPLSGEGSAGIVGDVYVGLSQARRQADALGVPLDEELVRLAIHGTLHVLGHDHPEGEDRESSELFRLQEELVRRVTASP
jgi:probable rRNA maturation factor